jgi:hypothetical protein
MESTFYSTCSFSDLDIIDRESTSRSVIKVYFSQVKRCFQAISQWLLSGDPIMPQTKLSFALTASKRPLQEINVNNASPASKRAKTDAAAPSPAPLPRLSTTDELAMVSREQAKATLDRLVSGYRDKSGASYPPVKRNEAGCLLAQKGTNRAVSLNYHLPICV